MVLCVLCWLAYEGGKKAQVAYKKRQERKRITKEGGNDEKAVLAEQLAQGNGEAQCTCDHANHTHSDACIEAAEAPPAYHEVPKEVAKTA